MGRSSDCIFCKIINGEIPSACIYEDDDFKVILDKFPSGLGHTLIVAKNHSENIFEMLEDEASKVFVLAKKVAAALKKSLKADGINILQNNGAASGQSVFHFHMHVIPRFDGDNVNIKWTPQQLPQEDFDRISEQIISNI